MMPCQPRFFGERRLVFIDRATFLTTEKGGKVDHDIDGLLQYIEHPEPTSVVVIFVTGKLDSRKKIGQNPQKNKLRLWRLRHLGSVKSKLCWRID